MKPKHIEEALDEAVYRVVWGDHKPKFQFLAEYAPGTMLDPEWEAIEMLQYELMAFNMRNKYGFNDSSK